ncbi:MAG TPA: hypothetical protein DCG47_05090 [Spirochaetaceae bacterium]|nr:hypothetical protein [Spirochaetaceae bacterium]
MRTAKIACLFFIAVCISLPCYGQSGEASVSISPAVPRPGELVLLSIRVPRIAASEMEALEPELNGPLRFIGSYLRPLGDAAAASDGVEGSIIELRLLALSQGRAEISRLGYTVRGRPVYLGSYVVDIAPAQGSAGLSRPGSWLAPDSAYPFAPFIVRAVGPSGEALAIATPSVRGALFYPVGALPASSFLVSISGATGISLPAMELTVGSKLVRVDARTVDRRTLPAKVEETRAVGTWTVEARMLSHGDEAFVGDTVVVEGTARGVGSAAFAAPPRLRVIGPKQRSVPILQVGPSFGEFQVEGATLSGERSARVSFQAMEEGSYTIELEPYFWYDTSAQSERSASARKLSLRVKARVYDSWVPSEEERAVLEALIGADRAGSSGDKRRNATGRLADAARALLRGDALTALHEAKALERQFWPPREAFSLSGLALSALNLEPGSPEDALPPPFWFALAALPCAALVVVVSFRRRASLRAAGTKAKSLACGVFLALTAILCLCLIVMCVVSWAERSSERAIVLVPALRAVPDEGASSPFSVAPGSRAVIVSEGGSWLFLEFGDGRSAWIQAEHIGRY